MSLTVKADGQARSITGVTIATTTTQIVYALAHAINQKGRFLLIARLGNEGEERRLSPNEHPLLFVERCKAECMEIRLELRRMGVGEEGPTMVRSESSNSSNKSNNQFNHFQPSPLGASPTTSLASIQSSTASSTPSSSFGRSFDQTTRIQMKRAVEPENNQQCVHTRRPMADGKARSRPPPPAYNSIAVERFNSLGRNGHSPAVSDDGAITSLERVLLEKRLTDSELIDLINTQREKEVLQRAELSRMDASPSIDCERELLQLKKQHNNLQTVLNSLRNGNWAERVEYEKRESKRLQAAIEAAGAAIGEKQRELNNVLEIQRSLQLQYTIEAQRQMTSEFN